MGTLSKLSTGLQHEWRQLRRQRVFWIWCVFIWGLSFLALSAQFTELTRYQSTRHQTLEAQHHLWEHQGELNAHTAAHHGLYAFKPWQGLSLVDPGLQPVLGSQIFLEAHKQNTAEGRPASQNPPLSRLSPLSLAAVFQILIPLAMVVLGYGQLSHERERGTLKMLALYATRLNTWGWSKWLSLNLALLILVTPAVLTSVILLFGMTEVRPWHLILFFLSYLVYWQIFIFATLILSGWLRSKQVFALLVAFWSLNTLIVPRSLMSWQNLTEPLPTRGAFEQTIAAEKALLPTWSEREKRIREKLGAPGSAATKNIEGSVLMESESEETQVYEKHYRELYTRYQRDLQNYQRWGWLFPLLHMQGLSQALAGSDYFHHHQFLQDSESYRQDFVNQLNQSIADHPERSAFSYAANTDLWKKLPRFVVNTPTLLQTLRQQRGAFAGLLLWWILGALAFSMTLRRMKVLS